ncbi:MAG: hypothetical protein ABIW76_15415 [Fibrobacteria bacterium]
MRYLFLALLLCLQNALGQTAAAVFTATDSLVVRQILDLNGKQAVPVDSAISLTAERRFAILRLTNLDIHRLPPEIGQLRFNNLEARKNNLTELPLEVNAILPLRNLLLDSNRFEHFPGKFDQVNEIYMFSLQYNRLKAVTAEDMRRAAIKSLVVLRLDYNQIDSITPELARFPISSLYVSHNRLASLPLELVGTKPLNVNFDYNRLCAIPDTLAAWISKYSLNKNWKSTQDCSTSTPRRSGALGAPPSLLRMTSCYNSLGIHLVRQVGQPLQHCR